MGKWLRAVMAITAVGIALAVGIASGRMLFKDSAGGERAEYHPNGQRLIFVLAGQSNMQGGAPVPGDRPCLNRVYVFGKDFDWHPACAPISDVGTRRSRYARYRSPGGYGPAYSFAEELRSFLPDSIEIGLIPAARGGTNIGSWQRDLSDGSLYGEMLQRAMAARTQGRIGGLLFFQGENDTEGDSVDHPLDWSTWFERFVTDFRGDVDQPRLPVVFAQIGEAEEATHHLWFAVKEQQAVVDIDCCLMIETDDLQFQPESVHFTAEAYDVIGERFAGGVRALSDSCDGLEVIP